MNKQEPHKNDAALCASKMDKLNKNSILKANGWTKRKDGKWVNPVTRKASREDLALNKIAKESGYKNYEDYKQVRQTKNYKRFSQFAQNMNRDVTLGKPFSKKFVKAYNKKFKVASEELETLLKYTGKRNVRSRWQAGETPKKRKG